MLMASQAAAESGWNIAAVWVSVGGVVVAAVITVWVTRRYSRKRRNLFYSVMAVPIVPPVSRPLRGQVEVLVRRLGTDEVLKSPHMVTLTIRSRSDEDITPSCFHAEPLKFIFNASVVALVGNESEPGRLGVSAPEVETADNALCIKPSLITATHRLSYTLLTEGSPRLGVSGSPANVVLADESRHSEINLSRLEFKAFSIVTVTLLAAYPATLFGLQGSPEWLQVAAISLIAVGSLITIAYAIRLIVRGFKQVSYRKF
ncbi:hypothetical protein ACFPM7_22840 [Actinokineospora guangxiensis]|uniref:RING-type E3 ubiquitin transferase n=1 Tax=Actinokineospora guangxiensis TaxID=1490288 RepID=A0ABW0ERH3_9PSEU